MPDKTILDDKKITERGEEAADDFDFSDFGSDVSEVGEDLLREMIASGLWYGRKKNKTHPKMRPYIFANRNNIEIIDLTKTSALLDKALEFLKEVYSRGGQILFVATQPSAKSEIESLAKKFKMPHVSNRWLGGTLTNFATLAKRVEYFKKLKSDQASGVLDKYTKKERSEFNKEIERLNTLFSGVEDMPKLPEAVFIVSAAMHDTALREANKMKIPVVCLISTDTDPDKINFLIPGNDLSASSIKWIAARIAEALSQVPVKQTAVNN